MYPWLRVMYAVVVIGSRMRRSACGMNLSTFCPCANAAGAASTAAMASAPITPVIESDSEERLLIGKSPGTKAGGAYLQTRLRGPRQIVYAKAPGIDPALTITSPPFGRYNLRQSPLRRWASTDSPGRIHVSQSHRSRSRLRAADLAGSRAGAVGLATRRRRQERHAARVHAGRLQTL